MFIETVSVPRIVCSHGQRRYRSGAVVLNADLVLEILVKILERIAQSEGIEPVEDRNPGPCIGGLEGAVAIDRPKSVSR